MTPVEGGGVLLTANAARLVHAHLARSALAHRQRLGTVPAPLELIVDQLQRTLEGSGVGTSELPERNDRAASPVDLIDAREAAALLRCSDSFVRRIHATLGGRKVSGRWLFDRAAVVAYREHREHRET